MTKLVIVRHGESLFNLTRQYTGQTDVPLTEKGITQAKITAEYILQNYKIDEVYSSDLCRAIDTARPVAEPLGLDIKTDNRLREINAGIWQGMYFADVREKYKEEYALYQSDRATQRTPGGEGLFDVQKRTLEAIDDISKTNDGKTVMIATHNGPLMTISTKLQGQSLNEAKSLSNNSITEIDYENGEYTIVKLGFDGHLGSLVTSFDKKDKAAN